MNKSTLKDLYRDIQHYSPEQDLAARKAKLRRLYLSDPECAMMMQGIREWLFSDEVAPQQEQFEAVGGVA